MFENKHGEHNLNGLLKFFSLFKETYTSLKSECSKLFTGVISLVACSSFITGVVPPASFTAPPILVTSKLRIIKDDFSFIY